MFLINVCGNGFFVLGMVGAASKFITLIKDSLSEVFKFIKKLEGALYAAELVLLILGRRCLYYKHAVTVIF